jgi:hypothetical protein
VWMRSLPQIQTDCTRLQIPSEIKTIVRWTQPKKEHSCAKQGFLAPRSLPKRVVPQPATLCALVDDLRKGISRSICPRFEFLLLTTTRLSVV